MLNELLEAKGVLMQEPRPHNSAKSAQKSSKLEEVSELSKLWEKVNSEIILYFRQQKGHATMDNIRETFGEALDYLNSRIDWREAIYTKEGKGYLKAYIKGIRVAQLSTGNSKLLSNEHGEGFLIWSVLGHISCNGKTPLCARFCYNNCRQDTATLRLKVDCLMFSMMDAFVPVLNRLLHLSPYKKTFVRIHEDGDFYDMEYFNKWVELSGMNPDFVFEAYTKEPELLPSIEPLNATLENFILRYSIMSDTPQEIVDYVAKNDLHTYIALGENTVDKTAKATFEHVSLVNRCMDSCQYCKKCYVKGVKTIVTTLH
ncbi:MAG: GP88 family protein [Paraclostridium sp.]